MISFTQSAHAWSDISRGHQSGELYFASTWYWLDIGDRYEVICYSDDYGQALYFKYICNIDNGDMRAGKILSDATDGTFYNYLHSPSPAIFISYDHCITWEPCNGMTAASNFYTTGTEEGIIYTRSGYYPGLYKSYDYANSFKQIKEDSVYGFIEVGTEPLEIYFAWGPSMFGDFSIHYSNDGGLNFSFIEEYDSTVAGFNLMGHYPRIFRGTEPGELYLVSWHLPENFKIFYSSDYGSTFEQRFVSPLCNFYFEGYKFTPGFDQGTFYYIKGLPWFDNTNTKVHIFYSNDTAKTFTEHVHILDSNFPVNIYEEKIIEHKLIELSNFPNPFTNSTTIAFELDKPDNYTIELFNLSGQAVLRKEEYFDAGHQKVKLNTEQLSSGVYLCSIKSKGRAIGVRKIVKGR